MHSICRKCGLCGRLWIAGGRQPCPSSGAGVPMAEKTRERTQMGISINDWLPRVYIDAFGLADCKRTQFPGARQEAGCGRLVLPATDQAADKVFRPICGQQRNGSGATTEKARTKPIAASH